MADTDITVANILSVALGDASGQIDDLIEKRAREAEAHEREARQWAESARTYDLRGAAELRQQWADYYGTQIAAAESMRERAVERLGRLPDEGAR